MRTQHFTTDELIALRTAVIEKVAVLDDKVERSLPVFAKQYAAERENWRRLVDRIDEERDALAKNA